MRFPRLTALEEERVTDDEPGQDELVRATDELNGCEVVERR
ncbi:MAG TPA: hypothetical protein VFL41_07435 [Gaiellaceae bacterium]|nr:hypothetical protein [Gaiellaceae bacterium]HET8652806.1 hypothetical protein [Gaiellaceae bacterium]